jgi:hypothetical protein
VVDGLNDPQAFAGAQLHVTPPLAVSLRTLATIPALCPAINAAGGACEICTDNPVPEPVLGSLSIPLQPQSTANVRMANTDNRILPFIVHLELGKFHAATQNQRRETLHVQSRTRKIDEIAQSPRSQPDWIVDSLDKPPADRWSKAKHCCE